MPATIINAPHGRKEGEAVSLTASILFYPQKSNRMGVLGGNGKRLPTGTPCRIYRIRRDKQHEHYDRFLLRYEGKPNLWAWAWPEYVEEL